MEVNTSTSSEVLIVYRIIGQMVKASASRTAHPGFDSRLRRDLSGSSYASGLEIGAPVATLPGSWLYKVGTGTCWSAVSIL